MPLTIETISEYKERLASLADETRLSACFSKPFDSDHCDVNGDQTNAMSEQSLYEWYSQMLFNGLADSGGVIDVPFSTKCKSILPQRAFAIASEAIRSFLDKNELDVHLIVPDRDVVKADLKDISALQAYLQSPSLSESPRFCTHCGTRLNEGRCERPVHVGLLLS